jgi:CheY-like chemotaxis protein
MIDKQAPTRRTRVLCVDDEPAIREVLALHLKRNAYDVETAQNGLAALELVMSNPSRFDVVITDNQMPQLDGIHLVQKLRTMGFSGKIVFFSSTLSPHNADQLDGFTVDAIIEKGRPVAELMAALARVLEHKAFPFD